MPKKQRGEKGTLTLFNADHALRVIMVYRARDCSVKVRRFGPKKKATKFEIKVNCPRPMSKAFKELVETFVV